VSAISSVSNDSGLFQFFHQVAGNGAAQSTASAAPAQGTTATDASDTTGAGQGAQAAGGHHHHHGGGHGGLFKKVESAVTDALQAAKSDPSADPNKVVQDAIAKVFKDNGVTPGAGGAPGQGVGKSGVPDGDGGGDAGSAAASGAASAREAFAQTLKSFGVSEDQFHSDFLAAVKDAQSGGGADSADVFKSFPPGSSVDTTA